MELLTASWNAWSTFELGGSSSQVCAFCDGIYTRIVEPTEEIRFDTPLQGWIDRGLAQLLPGCNPPIPDGMTIEEALFSGFVVFTDAGRGMLDSRIEQIGRDLGIHI